MKKMQHLRDSEDNLAVRDIQQKLLPHPLSPLLTSLGMTRWTECAGLAGKKKKTLFPTVRASDAGKPAHRIATVEILLNNILDHGTQEAVLPLKPVLVFSEKLLEVMKKHPVEDGALRRSKTINPCHGRSHTSRNGPTSWIRPPPPKKAARTPGQKKESGQENVNPC